MDDGVEDCEVDYYTEIGNISILELMVETKIIISMGDCYPNDYEKQVNSLIVDSKY